MIKDYTELGKNILNNIGGEENVTYFTHCITRLRFQLKDKDLVNQEALKDLQGTLGVQWIGEQFQIIIGNDVDDVFDAICQLGGFNDADRGKELLENTDLKPKKKAKWSINILFDVLSGCMVPVLPAICASGIIKGILVILTMYAGISTESGVYVLLNTIGDLSFYFMPFLVAVSAAKKFNTNTMIALMVAGVFLHPNISNLANTDLNVLGVNIRILSYSSTVFPILISVWVMSYVYKYIDKIIPKSLRFALTPALTIMIMTPLCLGIVGPIGYYIGYYLAQLVNYLFNLNKYVGGFILGAIRPFVLLTGMQTTFTPIIVNNLATLGYDYIWPVHQSFAMCCCGLSIGAFLKAKRSKKQEIKKEKENFLSSFISGFAGISEPTLYGNAFRFKNQLIALIISSSICGALTAGLGCITVAPGNPGWFFLPTNVETAGVMTIMFIVSFILTAILSYVFGFEKEKKLKEGN